MTSPHTWLEAYKRVAYRAVGRCWHIGRKAQDLDGVLAGMGVRQAVLMTAWNPRGKRLPAARNERRMRALHASLSRVRTYGASSGDGRWVEAQFLAALPAARASVLARRFGQNAIVLLARARRPRLLVLV